MSNLYLIHHELDLHISRNRDRVGDNYSLQNETKPTNFLGRSRIRVGCKIATGRRRRLRRHGPKVQVEGRWVRRPRPTLSGSGQESGLYSDQFRLRLKNKCVAYNWTSLCRKWSHSYERQWKWLIISIHLTTMEKCFSVRFPYTYRSLLVHLSKRACCRT